MSGSMPIRSNTRFVDKSLQLYGDGDPTRFHSSDLFFSIRNKGDLKIWLFRRTTILYKSYSYRFVSFVGTRGSFAYGPRVNVFGGSPLVGIGVCVDHFPSEPTYCTTLCIHVLEMMLYYPACSSDLPNRVEDKSPYSISHTS